MGETKEQFWRKDNPICYALVVSALILAGYAIIGLREHCVGSSCETNLRVFWESDPNEIGDTLAGLFSALAFVWIIATVMMQSKELAAQREDLKLTRLEMIEQRKATQDMAKSMASQLSIVVDERKQRDFEMHQKALEANLVYLCQLLEDCIETSRFCKWLLSSQMPIVGTPSQSIHVSKNPELFLREVQTIISRRRQGFEAYDNGKVDFDDVYFEGEADLANLPMCKATVSEILRLEEQLSPDQKIRIKGLKLEGLLGFLNEVCANPENFVYSAQPPMDFDNL